MRVLVVGSTGTIGKQLSIDLRKNGFEVSTTSRNKILDRDSIYLDLVDISTFADAIKKKKVFDAAVLCAAVTILQDCKREPEVSSLININSQVALADALLQVGTKRVVFLSSSRIFDGRSPSTNKFAEYSATTEYGRQKAMAETELLKLGQEVRVIRLTKVLSVDNPLLCNWVPKLQSGREVKAFVNARVSPVTVDDVVRVIIDVLESENESVTQFSATDEISYFEMACFVAKFLQVDMGLVKAQNAGEVGEIPIKHASLECSKFRSVIPTSSVVALQKVLEKMVSS